MTPNDLEASIEAVKRWAHTRGPIAANLEYDEDAFDLEAGCSQREPDRVDVIETIAPVKKRAKAAKVFEPHEHFGSPLNICRICGEKYTYVQRPDYPIRDTKG